MTVTWKDRAAGLARDLSDQGKVWSSEWIAAIHDTPRHVLVPRFYEQSPKTGDWHEIEADSNLDKIYSNTGLYTKIGPDPLWGTTCGLSSTSTPGLMTRMLETLDIRSGHRVLEIGTGTGYNAALLCHRLGENAVHSIDIDPDLVEHARNRLATLGYQPNLVVGNGAHGLPDSAPYDRLIATCAVPHVPWSWINQLNDHGRALLDIKRATSAGNLVFLQRNGDHAEGRFDNRWASFMPLRDDTTLRTQPPERNRYDATVRPSTVGYTRPWENTVTWFLAALEMPLNVVFGYTLNENNDLADAILYAPDGSWAEITAQPDPQGQHLVWQGGPRTLWDTVERAADLYNQLRQPNWDRFGLTVTPERQWVWIDEPHSTPQWDLNPSSQPVS